MRLPSLSTSLGLLLAIAAGASPFLVRASTQATHGPRHRAHLAARARTSPQSPAGAQGIAVYLDGKPISTESDLVMDSENSNARAKLSPIVVRGNAMVPVRLVREKLDLDVWMDLSWGIIHLTPRVTLVVGRKEAHYRPSDFGLGGATTGAIPLPVAPREIRGRLYMPVVPRLFEEMGFTAEWDRAANAVRFGHRR